MEDENKRLSERRVAIKTLIKQRKSLYHCSGCYNSIYEESSCRKCQYCNKAFCSTCRNNDTCPQCDKNWNYIPCKKKYSGCFNYLCKNT